VSGRRQAPELTPSVRGHLSGHLHALRALARETPTLEAWSAELAAVLLAGGRLLTAGNGGSAAEAQHLAAELVGRYRLPRQPLSAIALTPESCGLTAIANDFGWNEALARQVRAHGRPGDVLLALSTSGASPNLLEAARAARAVGMRTWALTGPGPNPLDRLSDAAVALPGPTAVVQEMHLVAIHVLCDALDLAVASAAGGSLTEAG
jgi:D-sedoheptulose 7-phosphate isomerase